MPVEGALLLRGFFDVETLPDNLLKTSRLLGVPSDRDGGRYVWPIYPSKIDGTFSEIAGEAPLHTDAQYRDEPESILLLACHTPAKAGGATRLLAERSVRNAVSQSGWSPADKNLLSQPIWRWKVPALFAHSGSAHLCKPKPILPDNGGLNWRFDNLVAQDPHSATIAANFHKLVEDCHGVYTSMLGPGDLLVSCNRTVLHARTSFTGAERIYYRVRVI